VKNAPALDISVTVDANGEATAMEKVVKWRQIKRLQFTQHPCVT